MDFRDKLVATLRALAPVLEEDVLVIGSEVPNLLGDTPVVVIVSQDVDIGVPVSSHARVRARLSELRGLQPSEEEPSVLVPEVGRDDLIEVNFVGMDPDLRDIADSYVLEDPTLPLLVLGNLGLLKPGPRVSVEGLEVPLPDPASLLVEKLLTERSGIKGERDLLVALALLVSPNGVSPDGLRRSLARLTPEERATVRANLTVLSLMEGLADMPDPAGFRAETLRALQIVEESGG